MTALFSRCVVALVLASAAAACGGGDDGGDPPADAPTATIAATTASPVGGVYRAVPSVTLTADQDATIYYTTDGSTPTTSSASGPSPVTVTGVVSGTPVQFFAVTSAGSESPHGETYTIDRLGPTAVRDFAATVSGADVHLAWTKPSDADLTEIVVARSTDVAATVPTDGAALAVNDTVGAGKIIYVGTDTTFVDTAPGVGHHTYLAWARYKTGVYAEGRAAGARIATGTQSCQITIDVSGGTATVSSQPTAWTLAVANYANAAGVLTMDVTATSKLAGITFNPKLVMIAINAVGGAPTFDLEDGTVDLNGSFEYKYFGPNGIDNGGSATRSIQLTANGATSITLDCQMLADPGVLYHSWCAGEDGGGLEDMRTGSGWTALPIPGRFASVAANSCSAWSSFVISPDGRYVYAAPRSNKRIVKLDTTTFMEAGGIDLSVTQPTAAAARLQLDPSGHRLYAGLSDGTHMGGYFSSTGGTSKSGQDTSEGFIVEIAASGMTETGRTSLGAHDKFLRLVRIALSPDGRTMAAMLGGSHETVSNRELHLVDLSSGTEYDADPSAGIQTIPLDDLRGPNMVFDHSGRYLVIGQSGSGAEQLAFGVVDMTTHTLAPHALPAEGRLIGGFPFGDKVLALQQSSTQLRLIDPATGDVTNLGSAITQLGRMYTASFTDNGATLVVFASSVAASFSATTGEELGRHGTSARYVHINNMTP